jgi:hypothetical protein
VTDDAKQVTDIQDRLVAPCARVLTNPVRISPDVPVLLNRLLLLDEYVLQSVRFKEFGPLVRTLGPENVCCLLESGCLKVDYNVAQLVETGRAVGVPALRSKPPLPLLSFSFSLIRANSYNNDIVHNLQELRLDLAGLVRGQEMLRLEGAILKALTPPPENTGFDASRAFESDLKSNAPVVKTAVAMKLKEVINQTVSESELSVKVNSIDGTDYAVEANLGRFGLDEERSHRVIQSSLLAIGGLNRRIEDMKTYNALSGSAEEDLPLFSGKYEFLNSTFVPGARERSFERVLRTCGLPSFRFRAPDQSFDMDRFLAVRRSAECIEFRRWLRKSESMTSQELISRVKGVRSRLGNLLGTQTGRMIRFVVSTGVGVVGGAPLGAAVSALDTFLMERLFPLSGPTFFLGSLYPSLFEK